MIQFAPFAFLWLVLINQLRVEWTVNPQYNYGWAVPLLCAYLGYRRWKGREKQKAESRKRKSKDKAESGKQKAEIRSSVLYLLLVFGLLALLYAPTRLIQEANPEWRLVSWALALEVIGLTLVFVWVGDGRWKMGDGSGAVEHGSSIFGLLSSIFLFPLLFFLVAVPWPTFLEHPTVELLTRANVGVVIELLNGLGIPALQQGNVIEISNGLVGIDEACSGIRSVQASLMISLFLGEFYRLTVLRRGALCFGGLAAAFVFNVVRTFFLTWVESKQGLAVMAQWHDAAGVGVLVACFLGVWGLAAWLGRKMEDGRWKIAEGRSEMGGGKWEIGDGTREMGDGGVQSPKSKVQSPSPVFLASFLLLWLVLTEVGVEGWYRFHEAKLPQSARWRAHVPAGSAGVKELPLAETARQLLRYDEAQNTIWREADGIRWQMIYLRWRPGRVAVHLAKSHTPEVCLTAAGRKLEAMSDLKSFTVAGLRLPFRSYMYREGNRPVYVFYCLWEDRTEEQGFRGEELTYDNRFSPVWAGRRNLGQRVLEMAVWGLDDLGQAEAGLKKQLEAVIQKQSRN